MLDYVARRLVFMVVSLFVITVATFTIIQLPPGDYVTSYIMQLEMQGVQVSADEAASLRRQYALDLPMYLRYFKWMSGVLRGDFGLSFQWNKPVGEVIAERLALTVVLAFLVILFTYLVAIPIGIYSATHQYSAGDYFFTFVGFIGLAIPQFLLALVLMFIGFRYFDVSIGGLFSPEFVEAPWSLAKFQDMLAHVWIPIVVVGAAGTAGLIRIMRGCLLDELRKQYVVTAMAKGVGRAKLLFKYPVKVALNPIISTIGWALPAAISGTNIVAIVLNLPTTGPTLLQALLMQDMYLAGTFILFLSSLTVVGTLFSDILLAFVDPRIRYQ
jgi:peptide/nickel transport system permease protein